MQSISLQVELICLLICCVIECAVQKSIPTMLAALCLLFVVVNAARHSVLKATDDAPSGFFSQALISAGETVGNYVFVGRCDALGAMIDPTNSANAVVLASHELGNSQGAVRAHGQRGAFVTRLVVDRATRTVLSGSDLIQQCAVNARAAGTCTAAFTRFCAGNLASVKALFNPLTNRGTLERLFITDEETSSGHVFATAVTGIDAGVARLITAFNVFSHEESMPAPFESDTTVVALTQDIKAGGAVCFYVGIKQSTGLPIERAGFIGGDVRCLVLPGFAGKTLPSSSNDQSSYLNTGASTTFTLTAPIVQTDVWESNVLAAGGTLVRGPEDFEWSDDAISGFFSETSWFLSLLLLLFLEC